MGKIISNKEISPNVYLMKVGGNYKGDMGQFYMIRCDNFPLLSRPISIHNIEKDCISFLYEVKGQGTEILKNLKEDDKIILQGPYGNGFEKREGKIALIGGGMGIAPLFYTAKNLDNVDIYLGFSERSFLEKEYEGVCENLHIKIGGYITDMVDFDKYDYIYTCGPEKMMEKITEMGKDKVYVSVEKHMACGIGACLGCNCDTKNGNKKVCKDGPVFLGEDVYYE
ncbi:dihydroorotate dehydrogenase electron transfer subunit [Anaeromicrobium sediminis]|uniref:Dihydroorotate dehydrogenase electron transfer subunit n=1 Tax=Anaeromicrobium sediminis TaxID=1478221 RepID=A0A267M9C9_9FIRM|nr:dihydroorotate dehydrogenase electron transfer subunit [Anaeromicrobium sediminis]PAB56171.1 dihydroorotate dehydrogenase electron transfer subunit [Anaeromicrobium sediminis]